MSKQHAIETLKFAHDYLEKGLKGFDDTNATKAGHGAGNHALWTVGHLATTYAWLATLLDTKANAGVPDSYNGLFGMDSKPSPDKSKYPAFAEVKKAYDKAWTTYFSLVGKLADKDLAAPCVSEAHGFASSRIDTAYKCAWHDGFHAGQVAEARRALGMNKK